MAGETTTTTAINPPNDIPAGAIVVDFSAAFATTQLEADDVMQMGYLPPGKYFMLAYRPTDMDTNVSPAVVQKVTVGSTDVVTGLTGGQTGTASVNAFTPITLTEKTLVKVQTTTVPGTAAAGTVYLTFFGRK